jgi:phytoene dehydrogenase-like protein
LKVVVCERRYEIGGGLATEEILFPGNSSNTHAIYHIMMVDYIPPLRDFDLEEHGLYWVKPFVQSAIIFGDKSSILFGKML